MSAVANRLTFGRYKGLRLSDVPMDYLRWLTNPVLKNGETVPVPEWASEGAKAIILASTACEDAMSGKPSESTRYVIERDGDLCGLTIHLSLDDALLHLCSEYPIQADEDGVLRRETPDPEDDRILVWEVLPTGHRRVVWHFSGWHYNQDEYGPQGALPGDTDDLYTIAMKDY